MRYQFDQFELDADRYELRLNGVAQHVEPLVFDLIVFFAANAGRLVGREEIVERVWRGRAVSDATISSCIKSARRALGDSGEAPGYIRTVRGRGFEFTGAVTTVGVKHSSVEASGQPVIPLLAPLNANVPALRIDDAVARETMAQARGVEPAARPVLAVMPLANLSVEADEYFADGLTEDIITNLARFRDLRVIAGASTRQIKDLALEPREICERLHAGYIVQGSVRRAAGRVRISVQLIDGASSVQLWGDRYDREMGDIFGLQDEVTRTIAATLGVTVQDVALQRALKKSSIELDAYDCILRARRYTRLLSAEMHAEARELLERAVELDPLSHRVDITTTLLRAGRIDEAIVRAEEALELESHERARATLGWAYFLKGRQEVGLAELEAAVAMAPGALMWLAQLGEAHAMAGNVARAREILRSLEECARELYVPPYYFAYIHTGLGEADRAMDYLERAVAERAGPAYSIKGSFLLAPLRAHPRFRTLLRQMNLA